MEFFTRIQLNKKIILKHALFITVYAAIAIAIHLVIPGIRYLLPYALVFTLLIYRSTERATKAQFAGFIPTLAISMPFVLIVCLYLRPYVWTIPIVFYLYILSTIIIGAPRVYHYGGMFIITAYFTKFNWQFNVLLFLDVCLLSIVSLTLARFFYISDKEQLQIMYKRLDRMFPTIVKKVYAGEEIDVSVFFELYNETRNLALTLRETQQITVDVSQKYAKLFNEIEESYFYLRTLSQVPELSSLHIAPTLENLTLAIPSDKVKDNRSIVYYQKNLARHYKVWQSEAQVLKESGLL